MSGGKNCLMTLVAGVRGSSDWLPTWVIGLAGEPASVALGPRPLDGFNLWSAWTGSNATSPRTEVIHQVVNRYTDANCHNGTGLPPVCFVPFGSTIRVGKFKLHLNSHPGPDFTVPWPTPADEPVEFGLSSGGLEPGTDHMRAGGVRQNQTGHQTHTCFPACLYDLVADPGETHDLAGDPAMYQVIVSLTARVQAAAATGPPWAWLDNSAARAAVDHNCVVAEETGYYEPVLESFPPPEPPPPPPPAPVPKGPLLSFERAGKCLMPVADSVRYVTMGECSGSTGERSQWQVGWIRGMPTLESVYLRQRNASSHQGWCLHTGQTLSNNSCQAQVHLRSCYDGIKPQKKGGNPLGTGFAFTNKPDSPRHSCFDNLRTLCHSARRASVGNCWVCEGMHQSQLHHAGCTQAELVAFCQANASGGGEIQALSCLGQGGADGLCVGVGTDGQSVVLVPCSAEEALGWQQHTVTKER
jgi:hypothetical protein